MEQASVCVGSADIVTVSEDVYFRVDILHEITKKIQSLPVRRVR